VKIIAITVVAALSLFGCTSGGNEVDEAFLEGRETVEIYKLLPPDDFEPVAFVELLADVFGVVGGSLKDDRDRNSNSLGIDAKSGNPEIGSVGLSMQFGGWGHVSRTLELDDDCAECAPVDIDHDTALARAKALYTATGTVNDDFEWVVEQDNTRSGKIRNDYQIVRVTGYPTIDGQRLSDRFEMEFGNGDEVLRATGEVYSPRPVGTVGLLTPAEALAGETAALGVDVPPESTDVGIEWSTFFDRGDLETYVVPVYRFPISAAQPTLTNEVPAFRPQDLPD